MAERKARRGDWVQIHNILLQPGERAPQVPDDTRKVPFEMFLKGFLRDEEARIGQAVTIETIIGRQVRGTLVAINPAYPHDFGKPVPELLSIGPQLRAILAEEEGNRE